MNCKKTRSLFGRFLDQGLEQRKARSLMLHLDSCPECARAWERFRLSLEELKNLERIEPSPAFESELWRRIHTGESESAWRSAWARVESGALWTKMAAAAAAAAIVVGGLLVSGVVGPGRVAVPVVENMDPGATTAPVRGALDFHRADVDLVGNNEALSDWDIPNWAWTHSGRLERGFMGIEGIIDTAEVEPEFVIRRVSQNYNSPPRRAF
ncbi:MAG: zf-HC2 domain-containing protein [Candidatus Eisenbacteria sp.]|nr:zf-HC2 domain-containing protein [Candidatus Eisenbacteria bacterium]